ncbi:hypothetical protein C0995_011736 [Termitomyces sp. Mi166|nr:hypothetical protein C0995_011736 [Termitomyces sp. Mi166\
MPNHLNQQHPHDDTSGPAREPDVYYLLPNKYGPSLKPIARRPPPPPVSPPMDDDFDVATTRGANTEWSSPAHRLERPRSPSPPNYARATITKAPIAGPSTLKPRPTTPSPRRKGKDEVRGLNSDARESRDRELYETHGDYGRIMNELDRKFGAGPDLTLSPTRSRKEQESSEQAAKATITTNSANATANTGISRIGYPARLGSVSRPTGAGVHPRRSFEMVDRRVLESGPERTVTISTWREQVAHEADQQANMNIYYLDPHDYAAEGEVTLRGGDEDGDEDTEEEEASSVRQMDGPRVRKRSVPLPPPPLREGSESGSDPGSIIRTITDEHSESAPVSQVRRTASPSTTSHSRRSPVSKHSSGRKPKSRSGGSGSQPGIWQPTPPQTPPRPVWGPTQDLRRGISPPQPIHVLSESAGGSRSSPGRVAVTLPRQIPDHSRPKTQPMAPRSSTPNRIYMRESTPSFHPTRSGSTISTIKSASTVALEQILGSCDPSLIHVAPALARLGIRNDVHLRAIARLSDETRDRELRDAALKEGITVMDWAILLDKLQTLYIRSRDLSAIVERPERLRAVTVGLSAALARLESISSSTTPKSEPVGPDDLAGALNRLNITPTSETFQHAPVSVVRSTATVDLLDNPAVKFIHGDIDGDVYLDKLKGWARDSREKINNRGSEIPEGLPQGDLYLCPESIDAIQGAVGTVCEAVDNVIASKTDTRAFVAIRPPGHHCGEDTPSGFCFVNNIAIGAAHAHLKHGVNRVIIFDIDLHHEAGNGTQAIIWQINEETYRLKLEAEAGVPPPSKPGLQVYYGSTHDILSYPCEDGKPELVQAASVSLHNAHGQYIENVHLQTYSTEQQFWDVLYKEQYSKILRKAEDFLDGTGGPGDDVIVFIRQASIPSSSSG